ncbi:hypothetical protein D4R42_00170 [bacterium]|nr:MAG: hypothetical protein D4R42_00170 [bacterium]
MGRHKSYTSRFSWLKLLLALALPACLVAAAWTGYVLFYTHQTDPVLGALVFVAEVGLSIWMMYLLRSPRYRRGTPSFKLVLFSLMGITLVCAFAGIEPLALYKDTALDYARNQGDKFTEFFEEAAPAVTSPESEDITGIVAKVEPAVVMVEVEDGVGSGMIVDKSGYILTSNHIVENVQSARIIFGGGGQYEGTVIGKDEVRDLAIIKITAVGFDFPAVTFGDSDTLEGGEAVIVIGYSLGLEGGTTVSKGIISAFRDEDGVRYIQTDAAINPGNSGGPLINLKGEVIGIVTSKVVHEAVEGMGFAVAINTVKPLISERTGIKQTVEEVEETQREEQSLLELEKEVFRLINIQRQERGIPPVAWSETLHDGARKHSENMQKKGSLYHDTHGQFAECCYGGPLQYSPSSITATGTVNSWMSSPGHRAIVLDGQYRQGAVGIARDTGFFATYRCY